MPNDISITPGEATLSITDSDESDDTEDDSDT